MGIKQTNSRGGLAITPTRMQSAFAPGQASSSRDNPPTAGIPPTAYLDAAPPSSAAPQVQSQQDRSSLELEARRLWKAIKPQLKSQPPKTGSEWDVHRNLLDIAYPGPKQLKGAEKTLAAIAQDPAPYPAGSQRLAEITAQLTRYQARGSYKGVTRMTHVVAFPAGLLGGAVGLVPGAVAAAFSAHPGRTLKKVCLYGSVTSALLLSGPVSYLANAVGGLVDLKEQHQGAEGSSSLAVLREGNQSLRRLRGCLDMESRLSATRPT